VLFVSTWNVLADCYSGQNPEQFNERKILITKVFKNCSSDVLILQEVDHYADFYHSTLEECGYNSIEYLARPGRNDGIVIASKHNLVLQRVKHVFFDELANTLEDSVYQRANIGLLCEYFCSILNKVIIVANTHLYWNPQRSEIKTAQYQMFLNEIDEFVTSSATPGSDVIIGGDLNSKPKSELMTQISKGNYFPNYNITDNDTDNDNDTDMAGMTTTDMNNKKTNQLKMKMKIKMMKDIYYGEKTRFLCDITLIKLCKWLRLLGIDAKLESEESHQARTKKSSRGIGRGNGPSMLRDFSLLFDTARSEKRIILTTSRDLRERAACPASYLVKTGNFESSLITIVEKYGLEVSPEKFLTVCGKCGGSIQQLEQVSRVLYDNIKDAVSDGASASDDKAAVDAIRTFHSSQPAHKQSELIYHIPPDKVIFECIQCNQIYWWNDRSDSSPARAMRVAQKLYELIMEHRNNKDKDEYEQIVITKGAASMPTSIYATGSEENSGDIEREKHITELTCLFQTRDHTLLKKDEDFKDGDRDRNRDDDDGNESESKGVVYHPPYISAYSSVHDGNHDITNWNKDFKETLDYILLQNTKECNLKAKYAEVIPKIANDDVDDVKLDVDMEEWIVPPMSQPSNYWPSDHFLVRVGITLKNNDSGSHCDNGNGNEK